MDVLCCDKTGTLTEDRIVLERYLNTDGNEDARVLRHAFLNSFFQTGLKNLIDLAVIDRADVTPSTVVPDSMLGQSLRDRYTKVDEVPFDFSRRRLSVVAPTPRQNPDGHQGSCRGNARDLLLCRGRWRRPAAYRR